MIRLRASGVDLSDFDTLTQADLIHFTYIQEKRDRKLMELIAASIQYNTKGEYLAVLNDIKGLFQPDFAQVHGKLLESQALELKKMDESIFLLVVTLSQEL